MDYDIVCLRDDYGGAKIVLEYLCIAQPHSRTMVPVLKNQ